MNLVEVALYFNELQLRALEDHLNFDGTTIKDELGMICGTNSERRYSASIPKTFPNEYLSWTTKNSSP